MLKNKMTMAQVALHVQFRIRMYLKPGKTRRKLKALQILSRSHYGSSLTP